MKRIYHHYLLWEDFKYNFYTKVGQNKEDSYELCIDLYKNNIEFEIILDKIINEWKHSLEHNLTNDSLNKITYLGQAACAYKYKICSDFSREAFNFLNSKEQEKANEIAEKKLKEWYENIYKSECL